MKILRNKFKLKLLRMIGNLNYQANLQQWKTYLQKLGQVKVLRISQIKLISLNKFKNKKTLELNHKLILFQKLFKKKMIPEKRKTAFKNKKTQQKLIQLDLIQVKFHVTKLTLLQVNQIIQFMESNQATTKVKINHNT